MGRYPIQSVTKLLDQILLAIEAKEWDRVEERIQQLREFPLDSLPVSEIDQVKRRVDYILERLEEEREELLAKLSNTQQLKNYKF